MKTATFHSHLDTPVTIKWTKRGRYVVEYGRQVKSDLSYIEAARELGECILHSMACCGFADPEE